MRFKRLKLAILNRKAYKFVEKRHFTAFGYSNLQKTPIWWKAKKILIEIRTRKKKFLKCFYCKKRILYKQTIIMHHHKYNWKKLFKPRYIKFAHYKCHRQYHKEKKRD